MSERGSFVTEYIYCEDCFEAVKKVILEHFKPELLWLSKLPIIAGWIGGSYSGQELSDFGYGIKPEIEKVICHDVRIAVHSEGEGSEIFTIHPGGEEPIETKPPEDVIETSLKAIPTEYKWYCPKCNTLVRGSCKPLPYTQNVSCECGHFYEVHYCL